MKPCETGLINPFTLSPQSCLFLASMSFHLNVRAPGGRMEREMSLSLRGFLYALPCAAVLALLGACSTTQLTSGERYLSRSAPLERFTETRPRKLNAEITEIANIEPDLEFPARIGLAKIERNTLKSVSLIDMEIWREARDNLPFAAGEFVPLSPLITASVSSGHQTGESFAQNLIANIRRGSARQHLDYVLIYDVTHHDEKNRNALSVADISVLGLFALPSRNVKVESTASAILMDVRSGYPYGTASAFKEAGSLSTSYNANGKRASLTQTNSYEVVQALSEDVTDMLITLNDENTRNHQE